MSTAGHEAAANAPTAGEYIVHHLTHLNTTGHAQKDIIDFTVLNVDTLVFSLLMGILGLFVMWRVAKSATSGVPGRMQAAVELVLEMVNEQAKGIVHSAESRKAVGPLALTVFVWIFLMNLIDLVPVDARGRSGPIGWRTLLATEDPGTRVRTPEPPRALPPIVTKNPRFWDTVATVMPDYKALRRSLKDEATPSWE